MRLLSEDVESRLLLEQLRLQAAAASRGRQVLPGPLLPRGLEVSGARAGAEAGPHTCRHTGTRSAPIYTYLYSCCCSSWYSIKAQMKTTCGAWFMLHAHHQHQRLCKHHHSLGPSKPSVWVLGILKTEVRGMC